jgi:hypothetical protein
VDQCNPLAVGSIPTLGATRKIVLPHDLFCLALRGVEGRADDFVVLEVVFDVIEDL